MISIQDTPLIRVCRRIIELCKRAGNKRYKLQTDKQLPTMMSGTLVTVKGEIFDDKIIVESLKLSSSNQEIFHSEDLIQRNLTEGKLPFGLETKKSESPEEAVKQLPKIKRISKTTLTWIYIIAPILLIAGFFVYLEFKRKRGYLELIKERKEQNIVALRNYVTINLRKGFTREQIRNALVKNNYSNEEIEEAFRGLR